MTITTNELKRLADSIETIRPDVLLTEQQWIDIGNVKDILTILAAVAEDEPERIEFAWHGKVFFNAEYADFWRDKAMQLAVENDRLNTMINALKVSRNTFSIENEQLCQQLAEAQRYQPIVDMLFHHIDSMNDLCEPDFTADKVLKRFLDEVNPILSNMHFERRAIAQQRGKL